MVGPWGLEPQTSTVSIYRSLALQQLASPRGVPEYAEVAQDKSNCGLDSGLEKGSILLLSGPRLLIHVSQSGNAANGGVCCTGCDHCKVPDPTNWYSESMTYVRVKAVFKRTRLNDLLILGGPLDCTALAKRGYSHLAGDGGFVAKFEWAVGLLTAANTIEEIAHVPGGIGIVGTADDIGF